MYNSLWYHSLTKPFLAPPDWIFQPVWSVLYFMIFAALVFYICKKSDDKKSGYIFYVIQLVLNVAWSPVFFVCKRIFPALAVIFLLDFFVFLTIRKFYSVSKISGILLIPYFVWILFASYLNIGYFLLN